MSPRDGRVRGTERAAALCRDAVPVLGRPHRDVRGDEHAPHDVVDGNRGPGHDVLRPVLREGGLRVLRDVAHGHGLLQEVGNLLHLELGERADERTHRVCRVTNPDARDRVRSPEG